MVSPRVVLVGGTWSWRGHETRGEWYQCDSPFTDYLEGLGVQVVSKYRPFIWSSRVNGLIWQKQRHLDWDAGGAALSTYLDPAFPHVGLGPHEHYDAVLTHSHGLQVALYACAYHGAQIPLLIDVSGPVRKDMEATARTARPHLARWVHVSSDWTDRMQWFGELFDGAVGIKRGAIWQTVHADVSILVPGVGHSGLLRDPRTFFRWERDLALVEELRAAAEAGA